VRRVRVDTAESLLTAYHLSCYIKYY
jgi:hypothetical protein